MKSRQGERLKGKYRLEELLGTGGMSEVYRARNPLVNRDVAIKILHPHLVKNREVVGRFMREAKAANAVAHRHIVDILDVDTDDHGMPFIVQEYLEGVTLAQRLEAPPGRLTPDETLALLAPIVDAVAAAHEAGIVHRDLKPENIYLATVDGETVPKVLDFGISKVPLEEEAKRRVDAMREEQPSGARLTMAGAGLGTPYYMSPEQIRDPAGVDARTDIWSFGVIFYEALSGRMPFEAEDVADLFGIIQTQDPPDLRRLAPETPAALARIVRRCLSPVPSERFADAKELGQALRTVTAAPKSPPSRPRPAARELDVTSSSSPPSSSRAPTRSRPSFDDLELELDLSGPASGPPSKRGPRSRQPVPSVQPPDDEDDPFGLDDGFGGDAKLELAVDVPASSPRSSAPNRPRAAATAAMAAAQRTGAARRDTPPSSRRDIHVRRRSDAPPGVGKPIVRLVLGGTLIAATYASQTHLTPDAIASHQASLGGATATAIYAGGATIALVATIWIALAGLRRVAFSLLLSTVGYAALTLGALAALSVLAAPGLMPPVAIKFGFLLAPWGGVVGAVGLAAFAWSTARDFRQDPDRAWLAIPSFVAAAIALGAAGWMGAAGPHLGLSDLGKATRAAEPNLARRAQRFTVALQGAAALSAAHDTAEIDERLRAAAKVADPP